MKKGDKTAKKNAAMSWKAEERNPLLHRCMRSHEEHEDGPKGKKEIEALKKKARNMPKENPARLKAFKPQATGEALRKRKNALRKNRSTDRRNRHDTFVKS